MSPRSKQQFEQIRVRSRTAILKAALRLFSRKGYGETTIADIARRVGISKGLVYNYFTGKEAILAALIDDFAARIMPALPDGMGGQSASDYLERLIRGWFREIRTNSDLIKLGVEFHTDPALKKLVKKKQADLERKYIGFFQEVFRKLGSADPEVETLVLGAILDGVGLNYAGAPGRFPLDKMERHLIHHYCRLQGTT